MWRRRVIGILACLCVVAIVVLLLVLESGTANAPCMVMSLHGQWLFGEDETVPSVDTGRIFSFKYGVRTATTSQTTFVFTTDFSQGITEGPPRFFSPRLFAEAMQGDVSAQTVLRSSLQSDRIDPIADGLVAYASSTFGGGSRIDIMRKINERNYALTEIRFPAELAVLGLTSSTLEMVGLRSGEGIKKCEY